MQLNAKQLRLLDTTVQSEDIVASTHARNPLYFILDNIYDTYNIGGLFRLADALNISKLYICGNSETPPNHKIKKASIGTYKVVPWEYKRTAVEAITDLKKACNAQIVAIEQDKQSVPYETFEYKYPLALVLGHETNGASQQTLNACDAVVEIPMFGLNISLNVIVSAAIVAYHARIR